MIPAGSGAEDHGMDLEQGAESEQSELAQQGALVVFEGDVVTGTEIKLPAMTLTTEKSYARGRHIRLNLEVRVKNIRLEETKDGLVRQHVVAFVSINEVANFNPEEAADDVGGSASGQAVPSAEAAEELGLRFGRSSDKWNQPDVSPASGF